ncbi:MAG: hypothetical protein II629_09025 [Ruminococcus sp.]|nr:hypothetical protein [Ruminococcus sp.]
MITLHDLDTAIAHCQGESNPNAETCKQLAAFYTIKQAMFGEETAAGPTKAPAIDSGYSGAANPAPQPKNQKIFFDSGSEFAQAIDGKNAEQVLDVLDELLGVLQATKPRLYGYVLDQLYLI